MNEYEIAIQLERQKAQVDRWAQEMKNELERYALELRIYANKLEAYQRSILDEMKDL